MSEVMEHDCYGNPFLEQFRFAVEFKIKFLIESGVTKDNAFDEVKRRSGFLEDSELEIFLYPTPKSLKKADAIFQGLTEIVALLAYIRGGIEMFGWWFKVIDGQVKIEKVEGYAHGKSQKTPMSYWQYV